MQQEKQVVSDNKSCDGHYFNFLKLDTFGNTSIPDRELEIFFFKSLCRTT